MATNKSGVESSLYDREQHLEEVSRLLRAGFSQQEVAGLLGVSEPQITYDIKQIRKRQAEAGVLDKVLGVNEKIAQLRDLRRTATIAYMKSMRKKHKKVTELEPEMDCAPCNASGVRVDDKGETSTCKTCDGRGRTGGIIKVIETVEGQCGDPSWLSLIRQCLKDERDLLGLDAEKRVNIKGQVDVVDWSVILDSIPPDIDKDVIEVQLERKLEQTTTTQSSAGYLLEPTPLPYGLKELPLSKRAPTKLNTDQPPDTTTNGDANGHTPTE